MDLGCFGVIMIRLLKGIIICVFLLVYSSKSLDILRTNHSQKSYKKKVATDVPRSSGLDAV